MSTDLQSMREQLGKLRGFLKLDPSNASLLRDAAGLAINSGDFDAARELLAQAIEKHPEDSGFRFQSGTLALATNRPQVAAEQFQSLLDEGQKHSAIRYNLAYAKSLLREFKEARECLDGMTAEDFTAVPEAQKLYARACHHLEDCVSGIAHLEKYLQFKPDDAEAWGMLALLLFDKDDEAAKAKKTAEHALALNPSEPNALLTLGSLGMEQQEPDLALEFLGRLLESQPKNGRAWSGVAFARMLKLDLKGAKEAFLKAVEFMPDHIGTWHGLSWIQILGNDLKGAEESLNRAMAIDRNFDETHGGLAVIAVLQGREREAEPMIKRAIGLNPRSFAGQFARSLLLSRSGQKEKGQELIQKIIGSIQTPDGKEFKDLVAKLVAGVRKGKPRERK